MRIKVKDSVYKQSKNILFITIYTAGYIKIIYKYYYKM